MATLNFDNVQYDLDTLSVEAKGHLGSLQFIDAEIQKLQAQLAVYQTARAAYLNGLKASLPDTAGMLEKVMPALS